MPAVYRKLSLMEGESASVKKKGDPGILPKASFGVNNNNTVTETADVISVHIFFIRSVLQTAAQP